MKIEAKQNEGKTKIKRELEDQIDRAKSQAAKCDQKYNVDLEVIRGISPSVTNIFNKVGCEDEVSDKRAWRRSGPLGPSSFR